MISNITGSITARVDLQAVQQKAQDIVKKVQEYALPIIATIGAAATAVTAYATGGIASPETLFAIASSVVAYLAVYLSNSKEEVANVAVTPEATTEAVQEEVANVAAAVETTTEAVQEEVANVAAAVEATTEAVQEEVANVAAAVEATTEAVQEEVANVAAAVEATTEAVQEEVAPQASEK